LGIGQFKTSSKVINPSVLLLVRWRDHTGTTTTGLVMLAEISPQDVLEDTWLTSYEQNTEIIWQQLIRLNLGIRALNKLTSFPFDLFETTPQHFWRLVVAALFEMCVMIIWRIAVDTEDTGLTLQQFKNQICQHIRNDKYCNLLNDSIRQKHLNKEIDALGQKIKEIRHNFIAHLNLLQHIDPTLTKLSLKPLVLSEIEQYQKTVNEYFELLCFGNFKALLPWEYGSDDVSEDDIDRLLVNIAQNSTLINAPEKNPYLWPGILNNLTESQVEILNKYRSKLGLSLV
jgi:hypothetical protein